MDNFEKLYDELRKKGFRMTDQRKEIIDILRGKHLSFNEIKEELIRRDFKNLATLYNNIDFLLEHEIIIKLSINGETYYDLAIDEMSHDAASHIHVTCNQSELIVEAHEERIFDFIRNDSIFKDFDIEKIQIVIKGSCKYRDSGLCSSNEQMCFQKQHDRHSE